MIEQFMRGNVTVKLLLGSCWLMFTNYGILWTVYTKQPYRKPHVLYYGESLEEALKVLSENGGEA